MKIVKLIPRNHFSRLKSQYDMDKRIKHFDTWSQLLVLLYSALSQKGSIRPLLDSFNHLQTSFSHLNVKEPVRRSTFSDANNHRDFTFFKDLFESTYQTYRPHLSGKVKNKIRRQVNLMDSTFFTLSCHLSSWAFENLRGKNRYQYGSRVHCLFDVNAAIPSDIIIERGNTSDLKIARSLRYKAGEIYVADRGYFSFKWFDQVKGAGAYFLTRAKHFEYEIIEERTPTHKNVMSDQIVRPIGKKSAQHYEGLLRMISYLDPETEKELTFITTLMDYAAKTIADLYKIRWQIEIFFRELKHYFKLRSFLGNSKGAIAIQIYAYAIAYILLKVFAKFNHSDLPWYRLLELVRSLVNMNFDFNHKTIHNSVFKFKQNQLNLNFET
jgi:hypothetical protein